MNRRELLTSLGSVGAVAYGASYLPAQAAITKSNKVSPFTWENLLADVETRLNECIERIVKDIPEGHPYNVYTKEDNIRLTFMRNQYIYEWFDQEMNKIPGFQPLCAGWQWLDNAYEGRQIIDLSLRRRKDDKWFKIKLDTGIGV